MADDEAPLSLAAHRGPPDPVDAGPCPDANVLAAFAAGTLAGADRAAVEAHLIRCEDCGAAVAAVADEPAAIVRLADARARVAPRVWAAAAVVLLGAAVAFWVTHSGRESPADSAEAVQTAFATLAAKDPSLRGLAPLSAAELAAPADVLRGGVDLREPLGAVLSGRPVFAWDPVAGATAYEVRVTGSDGRPVARGEPTDASWTPPPLARGRSYGWKVVARGLATPAEGTGAFAVASAEDVAAWERALAAVAALGDDAPRDLVTAHLALRRGYALEAERAAGAYAKAHPGDAFAAATWARARALLGLRPAEASAPR